MESFEQNALATAPHRPQWWSQYVDDTHMLLMKIHSREFTDHLNAMDDDIKWMTRWKVMTETEVMARL